MSLIRKHRAVLQAWACLALVFDSSRCYDKTRWRTFVWSSCTSRRNRQVNRNVTLQVWLHDGSENTEVACCGRLLHRQTMGGRTRMTWAAAMETDWCA